MTIHHLSIDQKTAVCGADITGDDHRLVHYSSVSTCEACRAGRRHFTKKTAEEELSAALQSLTRESIAVVCNGRVDNGILHLDFEQAVSLTNDLLSLPEVRRGITAVVTNDDKRRDLVARLRAAAMLLEIET